MEWTSDKPTKPGWYWFKGETWLKRDSILCVYVERCSILERLEVTCHICSGYEWETLELGDMNGRWYGPIEPPQEEMEK